MGGSSELEVINEIKSVAENVTFFLVIKKSHPSGGYLQLEAFKYVQWKVFEIKNDSKLTFEEHIDGLCEKASQKVSGKNFIFNEI